MSEARYIFTDGAPAPSETAINVAAAPEIVPEPVEAPHADETKVDPPPPTPEEIEEAEAQRILEEEEVKHKSKSGSAKLKERLDREREEAQRLRDENAQLRARFEAKTPPPSPAAPPVAGVPTLEQFLNAYPDATYDQYEGFKVAFAVEEAKRQMAFQLQAERNKSQWEQRAAKIPDFDTAQAVQAVKQAAGTSYSTVVWDSIEESEQGPELLDHLRKNPEEARRIAGLNERQAVKELGRLEERLASKAAPKPTPKPSTAPPPITPLQGGAPVAPPDESKKRYVVY